MTRIEDTLNDLRQVTLPSEARLRIREELMAYADMHAAVPAAIVSPFQSFFSMRLYAGFAAFLLIIGSVGGTAYAAENTLPGDTLYAVKVGFTEPLQTALTPSGTGKASWHAILAERRLEEAAALAAENNLSTETQAMLAANFTEHVEESVAHAEQLAVEGDTYASLSVRSDLEARLVAHEQILGVIAGHFAQASVEGIGDTSEAVENLLAVVKERGNTVALARADLEEVIAPTPDATSATTIALKSANEADTAESAVMTMSAAMTGEAQVEFTENVREQEVQSILMRHAGLLAKFATTTATSTQATTTDPVVEAEVETEVEVEVKTEIKIKR